MAAKSQARKILEAMRETLSGIKPEKGYAANVQEIVYRFLAPDEVTKEYTLCIVAGDTRIHNLMTVKTVTTNDPKTADDGWRVVLVGYLKTKTDGKKAGTHSLMMQDYIEDVLKMLVSKPRLGMDYTDACLNGVWVKAVEQYADLGQGLSAFTMQLGVGFDIQVT